MKQGETFGKVAMIVAFVYSGISFLVGAFALYTYFRPILSLARKLGGETQSMMFQNMSLFMAIVSFVGFGVALACGIALLKLTEHEKVKKIEKEKENELDMDMLVDDEKKIVELLSEGSKTQKELTQESEMSKVKIHRIIKKLEAKGIVKKYAFGMTNKIKLEKMLKK